jgi:DNA-binding beta-propeller fold protein YncE
VNLVLLMALTGLGLITTVTPARSLNTVVHTVDVGHHPVAVGIDPSTDRVYVVNDADDNVSVIDGPATQLPRRSRAHVAH